MTIKESLLRVLSFKREDWLGRHRGAREVGQVELADGYQITYRDGGELATYRTDSLGNVVSVEVAAL